MADRGVAHDEEYYVQDEGDNTLTSSLCFLQQVSPTNKLDYVFTRCHDFPVFEQYLRAIGAFHGPRRASHGNAGAASGEEDSANSSLLMHCEDASELTHPVDDDGQVTVK